MNLEEMQQAWKELNERVARNEILHREEVKRILNTRKESQLEKLIRLEKTGLLTIVALCLFCIYAWTTFPGYHLPTNITAAILLVGSLVLQAGRLHQLTSMKRAENLEVQIRYALRYKAAYNRTYLILYPIIILFAIMLVVNFHTLFNRRQLPHAVQPHPHPTATGRLPHSRLFHFPLHARPGEADD